MKYAESNYQASNKLGLYISYGLYVGLQVINLFFRLVLIIFNKIIAEKDRAPQKTSPPNILKVDEETGKVLNIEKLPKPKELKFPESDDATTTNPKLVAFAGCANLCLYNLGAAHAILQTPNAKKLKAEGKLKCLGGSSGAFVAIMFAMQLDCVELVERLRSRFIDKRKRLGGCIGVYSWGVRGPLEECIDTQLEKDKADDTDIVSTHGVGESNSTAEVSGRKYFKGRKILGRLKDNALNVSMTRFNPSFEYCIFLNNHDDGALSKLS